MSEDDLAVLVGLGPNRLKLVDFVGHRHAAPNDGLGLRAAHETSALRPPTLRTASEPIASKAPSTTAFTAPSTA
jgi:hypothetical protein